jgi:hypothetical protein
MPVVAVVGQEIRQVQVQVVRVAVVQVAQGHYHLVRGLPLQLIQAAVVAGVVVKQVSTTELAQQAVRVL